MLAFGVSSGLPFSLLIGTLTAWLGEAKVDLATVGVLAFAGLAYAFKFLWSPLVDRARLPLVGRLGPRKGWIVACQFVLVGCLLGLAATDPALAVDVACWFWESRNLNALADADDVKAITRRINGGYNGLDDRMAYLARARFFLK